MSRTLLYRAATLVLVVVGMVLVWLSWQVRLAREEQTGAIPVPPSSDSTIGRAFQDEEHGDAHGQAPAAPETGPPGGNIYAQSGLWADQDGNRLTLQDFSGRPTVFTFIYTTCDDACPLIVQSLRAGLAKVPGELRERARVVLFSFDPRKDSPPVLKAYQEKLELNDLDWRLLTAPDEAVKPLADMAGFHYARAGEHFSHNAVIAVANSAGDMVGWFADERITDAELLGKGLAQALKM
jgi:protein SCO1/2